MHKPVISDTTCFIILSRIGELQLLQKIYTSVFTTPEIANEFAEPLPDWVVIQSSSDVYRQKLLEMQIDKGEASAIALALELPDSLIILDDYKARKIAVQLGLQITGTLGVIAKAKLSGIIPSVKPFLEKINKTDFRMSEEIIIQILKEAGE